jgi:hypothetical protein
VLPLEASEDIIKKINNETLDIKLVSESGNSTKIMYEIASIDPESSELIIQIKIPDSLVE